MNYEQTKELLISAMQDQSYAAVTCLCLVAKRA